MVQGICRPCVLPNKTGQADAMMALPSSLPSPLPSSLPSPTALSRHLHTQKLAWGRDYLAKEYGDDWALNGIRREGTYRRPTEGLCTCAEYSCNNLIYVHYRVVHLVTHLGRQARTHGHTDTHTHTNTHKHTHTHTI